MVRLINEMTLEIPVLFKFSLSMGPGKLTLFTGPMATFLLKAPIYFDLVVHSKSLEKMNRDDFSTFGYGIMAGGGYDFPAGNGVFFLEGRYSYDFSDSMDKYSNMNFKQHCVYLLSGYRFKTERVSE